MITHSRVKAQPELELHTSSSNVSINGVGTFMRWWKAYALVTCQIECLYVSEEGKVFRQ